MGKNAHSAPSRIKNITQKRKTSMNTSKLSLFNSSTRRWMMALAILALGASHAFAQDDHSHNALKKEPSAQQNALINAVRVATDRFKDVNVAKREGYVLQFG